MVPCKPRPAGEAMNRSRPRPAASRLLDSVAWAAVLALVLLLAINSAQQWSGVPANFRGPFFFAVAASRLGSLPSSIVVAVALVLLITAIYRLTALSPYLKRWSIAPSLLAYPSQAASSEPDQCPRSAPAWALLAPIIMMLSVLVARRGPVALLAGSVGIALCVALSQPSRDLGITLRCLVPDAILGLAAFILMRPILLGIDVVTYSAAAGGCIALATPHPVFMAIVPVVEETVFRGGLHCALRRRLSGTTTAVLCGVAFAIVHPHMLTWPSLFVSGYVLSRLREWRGSLVAPIVMHMACNASVSFAGWQ